MSVVAGSSLPSSAAGPVSLESLRATIAGVREDLLQHPIYEAVATVPRLRVFMSHHVFAVWDFMCLAKRLQRDLTSLGTLWVPRRVHRLPDSSTASSTARSRTSIRTGTPRATSTSI
jgi:hypothetical protein